MPYDINSQIKNNLIQLGFSEAQADSLVSSMGIQNDNIQTSDTQQDGYELWMKNRRNTPYFFQNSNSTINNQSLPQAPKKEEDTSKNESSTNNNNKEEEISTYYLNPYADVDLNTAASFLGNSIESGNTLGMVGSGLKLLTGLGRNVVSGMGIANRAQQIEQEKAEKLRDSATMNNRTTYLGREDGGYIFENGGSLPVAPSLQKDNIPLEKLLTQEFITGVSSNNTSVNPNVEVEKGEHIFTPDGQSMEVIGKTHEKGGEKVELQEGDMVISDNLKLGGEIAKKIRKGYDVKVNAKNTFADVIDKIYTKIGLNKLIKEEEKVIKRIKKESENVEDSTTKSLNLQLLNKKLGQIKDKKEALDNERLGALRAIFSLQEETKTEPKKDNKKLNGGGEVEIVNEEKNKYKYQDPEHQHLTNSEKFTAGTVNDDNYISRMSELHKEFPEAVENNFNIIKNKEGDILDFSPKKGKSSVVSMQKDINNYYESLISRINKEVDDPETRSNLIDKVQAEMFTGEGYKQFDGLIGDFTSTREKFDFKVVDGKPELSIEEKESPEKVRQGKYLLLPNSNVLPPSAMDAQLKVNRRYNRITPDLISPEQIIQENNRQAQAAISSVQSLPDSQRAAAIAQITANTQAANRQAIYQSEVQNAQINNSANVQNAQIQMAEENAAAEDALSFEKRQQTAETITEENIRQYYDYMNRLNQSKYNDIRTMNKVNEIADNYKESELQKMQLMRQIADNYKESELARMNLLNNIYSNYEVDANGNIILKDGVTKEDLRSMANSSLRNPTKKQN